MISTKITAPQPMPQPISHFFFVLDLVEVAP
jgi:hypothetical protein